MVNPWLVNGDEGTAIGVEGERTKKNIFRKKQGKYKEFCF